METITELGLIIGKAEAEWFNQQLVNYNLKYKIIVGEVMYKPVGNGISNMNENEPPSLFKKVTSEELMMLKIKSYNYLM